MAALACTPVLPEATPVGALSAQSCRSAKGNCRPFAALQDPPYERAVIARKRSSAEGVGCDKATLSVCCGYYLKRIAPRMRLWGCRLVDVPYACQNFGGAPAMRNFDLSLSKFGSDAPRRHERRPSEFGPPKRRLRGGFEDQR